jgi:hypothetical protein
MSLTLRLEELSRFRVSAGLTSKDGRISLALQPTSAADPALSVAAAGVLVHFETVVENGLSKLCVFISFEGRDKGYTTASTSKASAPLPLSHPAGMQSQPWFGLSDVLLTQRHQITPICHSMIAMSTRDWVCAPRSHRWDSKCTKPRKHRLIIVTFRQ